MSDLPKGWASVELGCLAEYLNGAAFKPSDWTTEGMPIIRIQNLTDPTKPFNYTERIVSEQLRVKNGDILVSWSATLDAFIWDRGEAWLNQHIFRVLPNEQIVNKSFFFFLLRFEIINLTEGDHLHGSTMKHINRGPFLAHIVNIPPLAEQHRIVAKLDSLLDRSHRARQDLERIPKLLDRYKQAILSAAFNGDLTADWREENIDIGSVDDFIQSILVKRHCVNKNLGQQKRISKYKEPIDFRDETLFDIADRWRWVSADLISSQITDGEHIQPPYQQKGLPMLSAKHVRDGYVDMSDLKFIDEDDFRKAVLRCAPENGDVLIVSVGATTGRAAIVSNCPPFAIVRSVLLLKPLIEAKFIYYWINSPFCQNWIGKASGASAQPHFYINDNKRMPIPLPPEQELKEIVRRIEKLFKAIDLIGAEYDRAIKLLDRLDRSILAKAFRGELVPQDPNDEPATVLLERIKIDRLSQVKGKKGKVN